MDAQRGRSSVALNGESRLEEQRGGGGTQRERSTDVGGDK